MVKGFADDKADVLIALYGCFLTDEGGAQISVPDFKSKSALLLSSSYIALLIKSLEREELVESDVGNTDDEVYTLTESGVLRAEDEVKERGLTLDEFEVQYRRRIDSGLVVDTDHPDLEAAKATLIDLESHLRRDNDLGSLSADERDVALNEVQDLQVAISKPKIRTSYLWTKGNEVLFWIMEKGSGAVVGELAKQALQHLHSFINVFFI